MYGGELLYHEPIFGELLSHEPMFGERLPCEPLSRPPVVTVVPCLSLKLCCGSHMEFTILSAQNCKYFFRKIMVECEHLSMIVTGLYVLVTYLNQHKQCGATSKLVFICVVVEDR